MHYLIGTDSVHTTAAACDYLADRVGHEDVVTAVAVAPGTDEATRPDRAESRRDCEEALNVAPVRLAAVGSVETELIEGEPAPSLLAAADARDVDELVVGARGGRPDPSTGSPVGGAGAGETASEGADPGVGSTTRALLASTDRPVVVLPAPAP